LAQKDYAGAAAAAERALDQSPENVQALSVLVFSYFAQNQMATGVRKARERGGRQPKSALMQQFLGQVLLSNGDRSGARKAFNAARTAKPGLLPSELALAEIDTEEGRWDDARKTLSALVSSHPASVPAHLLFANLEMTVGKKAEAIQEYRKAVALDENNAQALNGLAYILAETRQPDEAMKYAQKAKELAPNNPAVDDTLGWAYFQKGLYTLAVSHLEGATAKEGSAVQRYHLAMAYLKAGDPQRGRQALDAALKMDPNLPEAQAARQIFGIRPN
jgi:tetratricopeptide (TPR) repeat protein